MNTPKFFRLRNVLYAFVIVVLIGNFFVSHSQAADLTALSDSLSRIKSSANSDHTITFTTPSGVTAGQTIEIIFPAGFGVALVDFSDIDLADDDIDLTLGANPSGNTWGAAFSGNTLTFTSETGTILGGSIITIEIGKNATFGVDGDQEINNPNLNAVYEISIAGTFGDTGIIPVVIVDDDQIQVSGDIYTTLSFSISSHNVGFGTMANTNVKYATANGEGAFVEQNNDLPVKLIAGTNAQNGLAVTIRDQGNGSEAGLYAALPSETIPAAPSREVIDNSKKYGVYGKHALGLSLDAGFDNNDVADKAISRAEQRFAFSAAQINGSVDVSLLVAIDATTKSGSYSDTITLTCTGNY